MAKNLGKLNFDRIGRELLSDASGAHVSEADGHRFVCFAHHNACLEVLADECSFTLAPYDYAFRSLLERENLEAILGERTPGRDFRVRMLREASQALVKDQLQTQPDDPARPQDSLVDWVEQLTRENCRLLLKILRDGNVRRGGGRPFNLVREFIWPLATMSVQQIVGMRPPAQLTKLNRAIVCARNLLSLTDSRDSWFSPRGDLASASNLHFGMLTIAAHIVEFGSKENGLLAFLAKHSLISILDEYEADPSLRMKYAPASFAKTLHDETFKTAMMASDEWSGNGSKNWDYDEFSRNILLELAIAMGGLMPLGFCKALQFIFGPGLGKAGVELDEIRLLLADKKLRMAAFSEVLRLNPPVARVFRKATRDVSINNIPIQKGDRICLLLNCAAMDKNVFNQPEKFDPQRANQYVEFGHINSVHNCFGEHIAKAIFCTMFNELLTAAEPAYDIQMDGLKMFGAGMPDNMPWQLRAPRHG